MLMIPPRIPPFLSCLLSWLFGLVLALLEKIKSLLGKPPVADFPPNPPLPTAPLKRREFCKFLEERGWTLSLSDESPLNSLVVSLIRHISGDYRLSSLCEAVDLVVKTETERIRLLVELEKERKQLESHLSNIKKFILKTWSFIAAQLQHNISISFNTIHCLTKRAIVLRGLDHENVTSLYLWLDDENGTYSNIVPRRSIYKDERIYIQVLLFDISRYANEFFSSQFDNCADDEALASKAEYFRVSLSPCYTAAEYSAVFNQLAINTELEMTMKELVDCQETDELIEDMRREIFTCLAKASKDACLRRAKLFEIARLKATKERDEAEKDSWILSATVKENQAKISRLRKELEVQEMEHDHASKQGAVEQDCLSQLELQKKEKEQALQKKEVEFSKDRRALEKEVTEVQREIDKQKMKMESLMERAKENEREGQQIRQRMQSDRQKDLENQTEMKRQARILEELEAKKSKIDEEWKAFAEQEEQLQERSKRNAAEAKSIEQRKAELQAALEKHAWDSFCLELIKESVIPSHELVVQRKQHAIFQSTDPTKLVEEAQKVLGFKIIGESAQQYLCSFVGKSSARLIVDKVRPILESFVSEPQWGTSSHPWKISANALSCKDVLETLSNKRWKDPQEIHLYATTVIYIDHDWVTPGVSVALSAPRIIVIGSRRRIVTSGPNAKTNSQNKAQKGGGPGLDGTDGEDGDCGESAGNVTIVCGQFEGDLRIEANGGDGAGGQSGGDGADGADGADGTDGSLPGTISENRVLAIPQFSWIFISLYEFSEGKKGIAGKVGGNGGRAGKGGQGGRKGEILLKCEKVISNGSIDHVARDGSDGADGCAGQGGAGGVGGRNGINVVRVFECSTVSFLNPLRTLGSWKEYRGNLRVAAIKQPHVYPFGFIDLHTSTVRGRKPCVGCNVEKIGDDSGRAANGEHGQRGHNAQVSQQKRAVAKQAMSPVAGSYNNNSDAIEISANVNFETTKALWRDVESKSERNDETRSQIEEEQRLVREQMQTKLGDKVHLDQKRQKVIADEARLQRERAAAMERQMHGQKELDSQCAKEQRSREELERVNSSLIAKTSEASRLVHDKAEMSARFQEAQHQGKAILSGIVDQARVVEANVQRTRQKIAGIVSQQKQTQQLVEKGEEAIATCLATVEADRDRASKAANDQSCLLESLERINGLGDRLSQDAMKEAKVVQKATSRVQRTADHQLDDLIHDLSDSENGSRPQQLNLRPDIVVVDDPQTNFKSNCHPVFDLLDQLVLKYAETDVRQSLALASLTQSLLLQSQQQQNEPEAGTPCWDAVAEAIQQEERADDPDELIHYLDVVNKDLALIELVFSSDDQSPAVGVLHRKMSDKDPQWIDHSNAVDMVWQFHQTPWSFEEIKSVLVEITNATMEPSPIRLELEKLLERQLLSILTKELVKKCSSIIGDDPLPLLNRLWQLSSDDQARNDPPSSTFYDNLFYDLEKTNTNDESEIVVKEFVTFKLFGVDKLTDVESLKTVQQLDKRLLFWLDLAAADVDQLEAIRIWAGQSDPNQIIDKEKQMILSKVHQVFKYNHWEPEWSKVHQSLDLAKCSSIEADQLKSAFEWRFCCHQKFPEKLQICSELIQLSREAKDVTSWIQNKLADIYGNDTEDEHVTDPSQAFLQCLERLLDGHLAKKKLDKISLSSLAKSALYFYDHGDRLSLNANQLARASFILLRIDANKVNDDEFKRDWGRLKTIYRIKWTTSYPMFQSTSQLNTEFHGIRKGIKKKWKETCLDAVIRTVDQPTKVSLEMDVLLLRYGLMTSWFLSPVDFAQRWKSLQQIQPGGLEAEIKKRINDEFSNRMAQLVTHVESTIGLHKHKPHDEDEIPGKTIEHLVNSVLSSLERNDVPVEMYSDCIRSLMLVATCQIVKEDGKSDEPHPIEEWRKRIDQLNINDRIPSLIKRNLSRMLDALQWAASQQEKFVDHLSDEIDGNHREMDQLVGSLQLFLVRLSYSMPDHDLYRVIDAAFKHLGDGQSISLAAVGQPSQLMAKLITIWKDCVPDTELHPIDETAESFLAVLLGSSPGYEKLRLDIATDFCLPDDDLNSLGVVKKVAAFGERFIKNSSEPEAVHRVQRVLIERCAAFHRRRFEALSRDEGSRDATVFFKVVVTQLQVLAGFLGETETQSNQIVLEGLVHLEDADWTSSGNAKTFSLTRVHHQRSTNPMTDARKLDILDAIYAGNFLRPEEVAFVERWIQTGCFHINHQVEEMSGRIAALVGDNNKGSVVATGFCNRLASVAGLAVLTEEEIQYMPVAGREMIDQMLESEHPSRYLHVLRENCTNKVYRQLMDLYYCNNQDPIQFDGQLLDQLKSYKYKAPSATTLKLMTDHQKSLLVLQQNFDRAHFFARRNNFESNWIFWMQELVATSLRACRLPLTTTSQFLFNSVEFPMEQLNETIVTTRPYYWVQDLLVASVSNVVSQLLPDGDHSQLTLELHSCLGRCSRGGRLLEILRSRLEQQANLVQAEPLEEQDLIRVVEDMSVLGDRIEDDDVQLFRDTPITQWPKIVRRIQLTQHWSLGLVSQLVATLDRRLGAEKTDQFLDNFRRKFGDHEQQQQNKILGVMLKNLSKSPWIIEEFAVLAEKAEDDEKWQLIQDEEMIETKIKKADTKPLDASQIVDILNRDPFNRAIMKNLSSDAQQDLLQKMTSLHCRRANDFADWKLEEIADWAERTKLRADKTDPVEFLAVACRAVQLVHGYCPRDVQLLAFLIFVSPTTTGERRSRLAQISTGEGKTLITALLAIYHALNNWLGERFVNIVTSSPVLAEENVKSVEKLCGAFGVSVDNNCDAICASDENVRRQRYNSDVIYGDLSSFQRDVLVSRFLGRNVTMNREPGAVIVDEVDSLLLDKGENILYLSHRIPEMDELLVVFVEIWNAVHAPDVLFGDEEDVALVHRFIRTRLDRNEILVPNCLRAFVDKQVITWIRSAFVAKNLLVTNDGYKVDDLKDGHGQQIVIMDKETGVEQVQMHWTHGLHQFLQLKHTMKLSPVSMKAVFMSNIAYFNEHKGKLYGLTGTLGSTTECDMLRQVFDVDFFTMPRFKARFCYEEDALLADNQNDWLENVSRATETQLDRDRAVLIVCENITDVDVVYSRLCQQKQKDTSAQQEVKRYVSSFDTEFQKKLRTSPLSCGDVIVATNLAGRGTDFKIDDQLAANGGLHVIIAYMPANARVEAQAQGRSARAGQLGSYQFVLRCPNRLLMVDDSCLEDVGVQLERLRTIRNEREDRRLDQIRTHGLQKIFLEGKLLDRYYKEIYDVVKKAIVGNSSEDDYVQLQLDFLTNRWAMWLDENASNIENVHLKDAQEVERKFDAFKTSCLAVCAESCRIRFAQSTTDLLRLGRFFAESSKTKEWAHECFERVIRQEPSHCESALIHSAWRILQKAGHEEKAKAKALLKKARLLIQNKMNLLLTAADVVKRTADAARKLGAAKGEDRFGEQVHNMVSLLQIHLKAIEDILGRPVSRAIALDFGANDAEAGELNDLLLFQHQGNPNLTWMKPFRLSKKVSIQDGDVFLKMADGSQKKIEWPLFMAQWKSSVVQILSAKLNSPDNMLVRKEDFKDAIVTRDQLWAMLKEEGVVGEEQVVVKQVLDTRGKSVAVLQRIPDQLPENLAQFKTCIVSWLQQHHSEEFSSAVTLLPPLTSDQFTCLTDLLQGQDLIIESKEISGRLLKTLSEAEGDGGHRLSDRWRIYQDLVIDWIESLNGAEVVSRESLPATNDTVEEAVQQLWNHLTNEGVIKDRCLQFPKTANEDEVQSLTNSFKKAVESMKGIAELCEKYHPTLVDQVTSSDVLTYLRHNPDAAALFAATQTAQFLTNPIGFIVDSIETGKLEEYRKENQEKIKEWLTKHRKKKQLDALVAQVVSALLSSAGQLKTMPSVSASFRSITEYFPDKYPPEIDDFRDRLFDGVIVLSEYKSWWDWRAFTGAMIGIAQIALGVAINCFSPGSLSQIGNAIIAEGVGDIIFAIQSRLAGTFSWQAYRTHKNWSVFMSVLSIGIGSYFSSIKGAAQSAQKLRSSWNFLRTVGKQVLAGIGQAVRTALTSLAIDKSLEFLKKHLLGNVLAFIRDNVISFTLRSALLEMRKILDALWEQMKRAGRTLADFKALVSKCLTSLDNTELHSIWLQELLSKAYSLGNSICNCFAESSQHLRGPAEFKSNSSKVFNLKQDVLRLAKFYSLDNAEQIANLVGIAASAIKLVTTGAEMVTLVAHGPEYVANVNRTLNAEVLSAEKKNAETAAAGAAAGELETTKAGATARPSADPDDEENNKFEAFKDEMEKKISDDVLKHLIDRVESVWLKPYLQRKMERTIQYLTRKSADFVDSLFDSLLTKNKADQGEENGKSGGQKELQLPSGGDGLQPVVEDETSRSQTDSHGENVSLCHTYEEFCDTIGERESGAIYYQLMANTVHRPILFVVGAEGSIGPDGGCTFHPNGKETSTEPPIVILILERNSRGSQTGTHGENVRVRKPYEEFVETIGKRESGAIDHQLMVNAGNQSVLLVGDVGAEGSIRPGFCTFHPSGKETSTEPTIVILFERNPDGSKHGSLIGPDGKKVEIPSDVIGDGTEWSNACVLKAYAYATNKTVDQLVAEMKVQAINDPYVRNMYEEGTDLSRPDLFAGKEYHPRKYITVMTKQSKGAKSLNDGSGDTRGSRKKTGEDLINTLDLTGVDRNANTKTLEKNDEVRIDMQGVQNTPKGDKCWANIQDQENVQRPKGQPATIAEVQFQAGVEFNPKNIREALITNQFKSFAATDKQAKYLCDQNVECHSPYITFDNLGRLKESIHLHRRGDDGDRGRGQKIKKDKKTKIALEGKGALPGDDASHLIACENNGSNKPQNYTPLHPLLNRSTMRYSENTVKKTREKCDVIQRTESYYEADEKRADTLRLFVQLEDGTCLFDRGPVKNLRPDDPTAKTYYKGLSKDMAEKKRKAIEKLNSHKPHHRRF